MTSNEEKGDIEEHWIQRVQRGDEEAFEEMFKEYYKVLTRFSWRYVNSKAIAEELVQEVFSRIWADREHWDPNGPLRSYLFTAVKHHSLDHLKHKKVQRKYSSKVKKQESATYINYDDPLREKLIREEMAKVIEELPPRGKQAFKLHRYDGLTYKEIAQVMDVSVKTVESQMVRTLKKLRASLSHLLPFIVLAITG